MSGRRAARAGRRGGPQLIVVTGKGGVGKSVIAAAVARLLAGRGRRVVLVELDPREPQHRLLGVEPSAGATVPAGGALHLLNLRRGVHPGDGQRGRHPGQARVHAVRSPHPAQGPARRP